LLAAWGVVAARVSGNGGLWRVLARFGAFGTPWPVRAERQRSPNREPGGDGILDFKEQVDNTPPGYRWKVGAAGNDGDVQQNV
jgi:hypothetical protein